MRRSTSQKLVLTIDNRPRLVLTAERITVCMDTGVIKLKCRRCGHMRPLGDFGVRQMKADQPGQPRRNQSWCRHCRGALQKGDLPEARGWAGVNA